MKSRFALLLVLCPVVLWAEPVYLDCRVTNPDGSEPHIFSVKLDEASGQITHTSYSSRTGQESEVFNSKGFFTANTISYQETNSVVKFMTFQYEIDRTTLAAKQTVFISSKATTPREGFCSIAKVAGRKI